MDLHWWSIEVRDALDAVPDRVNGLYVYPGRGGSVVAGRPPAQFQPPTMSGV